MNLEIVVYPRRGRRRRGRVPCTARVRQPRTDPRGVLANIREAIEGWLDVQQERKTGATERVDVEVVELAV